MKGAVTDATDDAFLGEELPEPVVEGELTEEGAVTDAKLRLLAGANCVVVTLALAVAPLAVGITLDDLAANRIDIGSAAVAVLAATVTTKGN